MDLSSVGTLGKINHWISACVILHNFLLADSSPDIYNSPDLEEDDDNIEGLDRSRSEQRTSGNQLRERVFEEVLNDLQ